MTDEEQEAPCFTTDRVAHKADRAIGRNLAAARALRRMSQAELATALNLHQSQISKIEKGSRPLLAREMLAIGEALNVEPNELLHGIGADVFSHSIRVREALKEIVLAAGGEIRWTAE